MRILQVFDLISLPHGGGTVGIISRLSRALVQRGHEVVIYAGDFELDQKYINSLPGVSVYPFHNWLNLFGLQIMPSIICDTRQRLKDFDVVHLHCFRSFQNIVMHHYTVKYGVPYLLDAHGSLPRTVRRREWLKWLLKWLYDFTFGYRILRDASKVIAETEVGFSEYQGFGVSQDRIVVITPPFPIEEYSQLPPPGRFRDKYGIKDKHIVMFLGRIHWIKGLDFLVESFHQLAKVRDDVRLVIVGPNDGYKAALDKLIGKLNLSDKVLFTGFLGGDEKLSALVDADVVVQTSIYEYGTGVPFEAVLCNTPIIVSENTVASENVRKIDAGYLVAYGNTNELSDIIQYIFNNPAEAESKIHKAQEYIRTNLSLEKEVEKYEQLYASCIDDDRIIRHN